METTGINTGSAHELLATLKELIAPAEPAAIRWFNNEGEIDPSTIQLSGDNEWEHM